MGLGAYLAAVTEREHYICEEAREREEVLTKPEDEKREIFEILEDYGLGREVTKPVVDQLCSNPDQWVRVSTLEAYDHESWLIVLQFMMDFELRLQKPNVSRAWISAATMGIAYFIGIRSFLLFNHPQAYSPRWSDSNGPLFRHEECHPRTLRLDRHYGRHSEYLRLRQKLCEHWYKASRILWRCSDVAGRCSGCCNELWHRKGY